MSRRAKTWLIVAGVLVVLGPILIIIGATAGGIDFSGENSSYETKTYEISATFDQIDVKTDTADIVLATADECKVVCDAPENITSSADVQDGTLVIRSAKDGEWYESLLNFSLKAPRIMVYLPEKTYNSLKIESDTGDVAVTKGLSFGKLSITGDTSDAACVADIKDSAEITVNTGDVALGGSVGSAAVVTTTGDVEMLSLSGTGDISVTTDTGEINIEKTSCMGISIESDTGDITLTDTVADGEFNIRSNTGDVDFERSDAKNITVTTTTGDVEGSLLTDKVFSTNTSTGDVSVPNSSNGGKCEINTSTGDITIKISK